MRAVIQRVQNASVKIDGDMHSAIQKGLLILLGIGDQDNHEDIDWLVKKIYQLRIFNDQQGVMNLSLAEVGGQMLVISQFTLHASTRKGNRPSFIKASKPEQANQLYEEFIHQLEVVSSQKVASGVFGADMKVSLVNDGPVTILMDTKNRE
ncbi:MAG: D-tyrosyl-tRNA(Tyr) deacylase [Bacteroidales bacterium]|nr:D-tyrosyl-tRNA(Tyr) deacylase [Bacteroidales bacterium]